MIRLLLRLFVAALTVCAFSACAGTSAPVAVAPANQIASLTLNRAPLTLDATTATDAQWWLRGDTRLYVSNWHNTITLPPASPSPVANSVSVFDISHNDAPLTPIPVGPLLVSTSIAFDYFGKLYVSNYLTQRISVFDTRHGNAELPSITAGLTYPQGLAFDRSGKLFVNNGAQINVYDTRHGNAALPTIVAGNALDGGPIAIDRCGKLYLPDGLGKITVVDTEHRNSTLPPITFYRTGQLREAPGIEGMTFDANGKLYVAVSENKILIFDMRRSNAPLPSITGDISFGPAGMVVDERGWLYVANFQFGSGNSILVFDTTNANKYIGTITGDGMEGVNSLALQFIST